MRGVLASTLIQGTRLDFSVAAAATQLVQTQPIADAESVARLCQGRPVVQQEMLQRAWAAFNQLCRDSRVRVKQLPRILTALLGGQPPAYLESDTNKFTRGCSFGNFTFFDFAAKFGFVLDGVSFEASARASLRAPPGGFGDNDGAGALNDASSSRGAYVPDAKVSVAESAVANPAAGVGALVDGSGAAFSLGAAVEVCIGALGTWVSGRVAAIARDGTYDVQLDSGETQNGVHAKFVRAKIAVTKRADARRSRAGEKTQQRGVTGSSAVAAEPKAKEGRKARGKSKAKTKHSDAPGSSPRRSAAVASGRAQQRAGARATTLASAPEDNGSTLVLDDAAAFAAGDCVEVGTAPAMEQRLVTDVDAANSRICVSWPLQHRYHVGDHVKIMALDNQASTVVQLTFAASLWVADTVVNELVHRAVTLGEAGLRAQQRHARFSARPLRRSVLAATPVFSAERPAGAWFGIQPMLGTLLVLHPRMWADADGVERNELSTSVYNETRGFEIVATLRQLFAKCANCGMLFDDDTTCSLDLLATSLVQHPSIGHLVRSRAPLTADATRSFDDALVDLRALCAPKVSWTDVRACFRETPLHVVPQSSTDESADLEGMRSESRQVLRATFVDHATPLNKAIDGIGARMLDVRGMLDLSWQLDCDDLSALDLDSFFIQERLSTASVPPDARAAGMYSFDNFVAFRFHRARQMLALESDPWIIESVAVFGRIEVALVRLRQIYDELLVSHGVDLIEQRGGGSAAATTVTGKFQAERVVPTAAFVAEALDDQPLDNVRYPELDSTLRRFKASAAAPLQWSTVESRVRQLPAAELMFQHAPRSVRAIPLPSMSSAPSSVCEVVAEPDAERVWVVTEDGLLRCWDCQVARVVAEFNVFDTNEQARGLSLRSTEAQIIVKPRGCPFVAINATSTNGTIGTFDAQSGTRVSRAMICWPAYQHDGGEDAAPRPADVASFALDWVRGLFICALEPLSAHDAAADASMNVNTESNIVVYNSANGVALASFDVPAESRGRYTQLLVVPEWSCLVAASNSGALAVWDTAATLDELRSRGTNPGSGGALFVHGECSQVQHSHHSAITSLVYLPTAMLVASASLDGTVRLWDVASGRFRLDDPALGAFSRYPGAGGFGTHCPAREQWASSEASSSAAAGSSFACKLVLRPSDAQLADDLMRPSAKGSVCTRLSVASVCTATQSADIALEQESVEMAEEIDRKVAARARSDPSGSAALTRVLSSGGFLYLLDSGELLSAPAAAFDARFVLLNSARPPPQVREIALSPALSAAAVDACGYDDLHRVLRDPGHVVRVFYVVANAVTLDLAKIKLRLEETGAVAGTRLAMERALPPQAAHFVCFYEPGRSDGPERSLEANQLATGRAAADRWVPGTVLAAFNNETYDVALDAAQKGADGMMCAVGRARLRIVSADGAVPPLYLPANAAPMGLTSVATYVHTACTRLGGHICTKQDAENVALLLHPQQRAAVLKAWDTFTTLDSAERGRIESERGGDEFSGFYLRARDVSAPQLVDIVRSMCSELEQVNFSGGRVSGRGDAKGTLKGSAAAKGAGKKPSTRGGSKKAARGGAKKKAARGGAGGAGKSKLKSATAAVVAAGTRKMPFGRLYNSDAIREHAEHVSRTIQLGSLLEAVAKTLAGRGFRRGQRVHVLSEVSGEWSPGTVTGVAGRARYDVAFRRGDGARDVPARMLRARVGREAYPSEMSERLAGFKCSDLFHRTAAGGGGSEGTRSRAQLQRDAAELATRLRDQVNILREEVGDDFEDIATNGGRDLLVDGRAAATAEEVARWLDSDEPTHPLAASLRVRAACEAWLCSALGRLSAARSGAEQAKQRGAACFDARRAKGTIFFDDILLAFAYVLDGIGDAKAEALSFAAKEKASQRKSGAGLLPGTSVLVLVKSEATRALRKQRRSARHSTHVPRVDVLCMDIESDSVGSGGDGGSQMMCYSVGRMVQKVGAHLMSRRISAATEAQARERFNATWCAGLARYRARLPAVRASVRSARAHEEDRQGQVAARIRGFWIDACGAGVRESGGTRAPNAPTVLTRTASARFAQSLESVVTLRSHAVERKRAVLLFSCTFLDMMLREQVLAFQRAQDATDVAEFSISPIDVVESFARLVAAHPVALHLLAHVVERDEDGASLLLTELVALVIAEPQGVYSPAAIDPATNRLAVPVLVAHLLRAIARVHSSRVSAATVHNFLRFLGVFKSTTVQPEGGVPRASAGIVAMLTDVNLPRSVDEGSKGLRAIIQTVESSCAARVSSGHLEHLAWVSKHGVWQRTLKGNRARLSDALAPLKSRAVDGLVLSARRRLLTKALPRGGRRHWDGARTALATPAAEGELISFEMHRSAAHIRARSSAPCGIVARGGSFDGGRRCVVVMHAGDQHIGGRGGGDEGERDDSLWDNARVQVALRQQEWLQAQLWVPRLLGAWPDLRCESASGAGGGSGLPESFALTLEEALPGFISLEEIVLASKVAATSSCYLLSDVALARKRLRFVPTLVLRYWLSEVVDALLTLHEHGVASWAVRPSAIAVGPGRIVLTNLWCSRVAKRSAEGDGDVAAVAMASPGTEGPPLQPQGRTQRIFDGCVAPCPISLSLSLSLSNEPKLRVTGYLTCSSLHRSAFLPSVPPGMSPQSKWQCLQRTSPSRSRAPRTFGSLAVSQQSSCPGARRIQSRCR